MVKKCLYCQKELSSDSVIDFCQICGKGVWGDKMFNAIVQNMENARKNGDLCHTQDFVEEVKEESSNSKENAFSL